MVSRLESCGYVFRSVGWTSVRGLGRLCSIFSGSSSFSVSTLPSSKKGHHCCHVRNSGNYCVKMYKDSVGRGQAFVTVTRRFGTGKLPIPRVRTVTSSFDYCVRRSLNGISLFSTMTRNEGSGQCDLRRVGLVGGTMELLPTFRCYKTIKLSFSVYCPIGRFSEVSVVFSLGCFGCYFLGALTVSFSRVQLRRSFRTLYAQLLIDGYSMFRCHSFRDQGVVVRSGQLCNVSFPNKDHKPTTCSLTSFM